MKTCGACKRSLPDTEFAIRKRDHDGTVISRQHYCSPCRRAKYAQDRDARLFGRGAPVDLEDRPRLNPTPFRTWIEGQLQHYQADVLAELLGMPPKRLWSWRNTAKLLDIDDVDRALCHARVPWVLREIYPELWDLPELDDSDDDTHEFGVAA